MTRIGFQRCGFLVKLALCFVAGCSPAPDPPGPADVTAALGRRDVESVVAMLEAGLDVYAPFQQRYRGEEVIAPIALSLLLSKDDPVRMKLYESGFDPNRPFELQSPAGEDAGKLHPVAVAAQERAELLEELLQRGGRIEGARTPGGDNALIAAVSAGKYATARMLLELGIPPDAPSENGSRALRHAVQAKEDAAKSAAIVRLLMLHGADPFGVVEDGKTFLHLAVECAAPLAFREMASFCQDFDVQDGNGNTPLHLAAQTGRLEILHLLMARGANPRIRNERGYTIKDAAIRARQTPTIIRLLQRYNEEFAE